MPQRAPTDAIAFLKADHRKVENLLEKFQSAREDDRKRALVREICTELTIHTMIEEEIFYPACKGRLKEEEILEEGYVEHDGAKVLIAELLDGSPTDEFYNAKVTVLSEMIKHHVKEEERRSEGLFAQARDAGLDMEALRDRLMARKEELTRKFENGAKLPPPQTRSYTGHKLEQRQPVQPAA